MNWANVHLVLSGAALVFALGVLTGRHMEAQRPRDVGVARVWHCTPDVATAFTLGEPLDAPPDGCEQIGTAAPHTVVIVHEEQP